jgi:acyl-CoA reductase-like NAD-dependent aldehyde dehydrogenase
VHDDADLHTAGPRIASGAFGQAGQSCISVQRVLVHVARYDALLGMLAERARAMVPGDVLDDATDLGPMIDEAAAARAEASVQEACRRGATLVTGGGRRGPWLEPTVLTGVPRDASAWCQEIFAPVVAVEPYERWEDALAAVDGSEFGLQAGIFTRDLDRVMQAWCGLEVGGLMVNDVPTWRVDHMPYGGAKASGTGREGVRYAMEHMTEPRLCVLDGWGEAAART